MLVIIILQIPLSPNPNNFPLTTTNYLLTTKRYPGIPKHPGMTSSQFSSSTQAFPVESLNIFLKYMKLKDSSAQFAWMLKYSHVDPEDSLNTIRLVSVS